ncbi:MAG: FAD binding domain-containing protein [Burkholderiaceae bacterium]
MKSREFSYTRPASLQQALQALASHGAAAQVLAGGQSLVPALNLRLAAPEVLVDLQDCAELRGIAMSGNSLRIGALTTHAQIQSSPEVARHVPLLAQAVPYVAHVAIRNRGTIGGSLSLADPAAEYPAVALATGATIIVQGQAKDRRIAAADFFKGLYTTDLQPGEILTAVEFPIAGPDDRTGFYELARRRGDYAMVGLAAYVAVTQGRVSAAHLAYFAVADRPILAKTAGAKLVGQPLGDPSALAAATQALAADLDPLPDLQAASQTKSYLAGVVLKRVIQQLGATS